MGDPVRCLALTVFEFSIHSGFHRPTTRSPDIMADFEFLDNNPIALPLNTPLLMMTTEGTLLKDKTVDPTFVELEQLNYGAVGIRGCGFGSYWNWRHLGGCFAEGSDCYCSRFKTRHASNGLTFSVNGNTQILGGYGEKQEEWLLLKPENALPPTSCIQHLARSSLQNPVARRELILNLSKVGRDSKQIAAILKFLYGSIEPLVHIDKCGLSKLEIQKQLFQMMKFKETAEACELVRLLYGVLSNRSPTESQNAYFKANKFAGYATTNACVDVDLSKIPLNTPVVMVSSVGTKLNLPEEAPCFVKLVESDGMIIIQSTDTSVKCLILDAFQQCVFGEAEHALRFKLRALSDGLIVFIETSTGCALEAELRDATTVMVCSSKYTTGVQSWYLCTSYQCDACMQKTEKSQLSNTIAGDEAGMRRKLIMQLLESEKPSRALKVVKEALTILYGSTRPLERVMVTGAVCIERQQQILELVDFGMSIYDIDEILSMMYGKNLPLSSH